MNEDIWLRAIPLTGAALYFGSNVLTLLIRAIRGPKDTFVVSQIVVKLALVLWLTIMAVNFWGGPTAPSWMFDTSRILIGLGAWLGLPIAVIYLIRAVKAEWRYWDG